MKRYKTFSSPNCHSLRQPNICHSDTHTRTQRIRYKIKSNQLDVVTTFRLADCVIRETNASSSSTTSKASSSQQSVDFGLDGGTDLTAAAVFAIVSIFTPFSIFCVLVDRRCFGPTFNGNSSIPISTNSACKSSL